MPIWFKHHGESKVSFCVGDKTFEQNARTVEKIESSEISCRGFKLMAERYKWIQSLIVELTSTKIEDIPTLLFYITYKDIIMRNL